MTVHHHPDESTIIAYAAGAVTEGFSLVLAAHIETCPSCAARVQAAENLGGELLIETEPCAMSPGGFDRLWERVQRISPESPGTGFMPHRHEGDLPRVLLPYLSDGLDAVQWRSLVPGIKQHTLHGVDSGNGSVRLLSIAPGTTIPHHTHTGGELTLVLKGSYTDELGRFKTGDLADLDGSIHHQPVADTDEPCICLIATDSRLRFSGVFSRMLQPLIGI